MNTETQIEAQLSSLPEQKQIEMRALCDLVMNIAPDCKLWYTDGKNEDGKVVANPNIGFGSYTIKYADGSERAFYRIGLCATKTGISVYILGLDDKKFLVDTYGATIGKASVSGYCISFRSLKVIDLDVLQSAIQHGLSAG